MAARAAEHSRVLADPDPEPLPVARADLIYLWDDFGCELLDFDAVAHPFGHRFQPIRDAVSEHMRYYGWTGPPGRHLLRWPVALASRLSAEFTGPDEAPRRVLFCEGARDALTVALGIRPDGGATVSVGADPVIPGVVGALPGDLDGFGWEGVGRLLVSAVDPGNAPVPFLREWVVAARERGVPVIFDESVTGFGRTGRMWGQELVGLVADATVVGGPVGGGLPLGAVVAAEGLLPPSPPSQHAGHPWACAAGHVVLDTLNPAMLTHADDCGREVATALGELCAQFPERLSGHHGVGLLRGLRFREPADAASLVLVARARGLNLPPAVGDCVPLCPVLVSSLGEMKRGVDIIADSVMALSRPGQSAEKGP